MSNAPPPAAARVPRNRTIAAAFAVLFFVMGGLALLIWRDLDARIEAGKRLEMEKGRKVKPQDRRPIPDAVP